MLKTMTLAAVMTAVALFATVNVLAQTETASPSPSPSETASPSPSPTASPEVPAGAPSTGHGPITW